MTTPPSAPDDADATRMADSAASDETRLAEARAKGTSSSGWLSSSGAIDHGRFPPGTVLGNRYRIVGRLGRGGMGEVFRADDLKLGQQVALKFLPPEVDRDPARLTQLHTEVRMARQVSHPNVCRVYDIDEIEGHTFLSMEYVDGEDLASLLRRIGRFPEDRGLEIARQICAGLAAAHERGVVHRDFKPANVMLDGTGRVRITDFGLAGASGETIRAGTPAYMAPEQLSGDEVTAKSDIYALGLVIYELFTGKRALEAASLAELIRRREQAEIVLPSEIVHTLSPEIDRTVMRCLTPAPAGRPASALTVAASLPGGDPLAAALAAGETPSPEMVAAAGEDIAMPRWVAIALFAFVAAGLLTVAFLDGRSLLVNRVSFTKSAEVLAEKAREVIAAAGVTDIPGDTAMGVAANGEYMDWLARRDGGASNWSTIGDGSAPLLDFWYRTSPVALRPRSPEWAPLWNDPPPDISGMTTVVLDDRGRLLEYLRVPPQFDASDPTAPPVNWVPMFSAAGLTMSGFSPATPQWTPRTYADERVAWQGPMPQRPDVQLRVEAASYRGSPVSFKVVGPWSRPARMDQARPATWRRTASVLGTFVILSLMAGAALLVRANLKSGRADRRGAGRIALALLAVWIAAWALGARHLFAIDEEMNQFLTMLAFALLNVGLAWTFYLALEPFVRRLCPDILIGWTRVLVGQVKDPRVGRDLLIGVASGVCVALILSISAFAPIVAGVEAGRPQLSDMSYFVGTRFALADMLAAIPSALQTAMIGAFMYVVVLAIVRRQWIAASLVMLFVCGVILAEGGDDALWMSLVFSALLGTLTIVLFLRFGLLALASGLFVNQTLQRVPLTLDFSQPHAGVSTIAMLTVVALAAYAFHISRAGEGLFRRLVSPT